jgi:septal ring factor EnvC (AmiA/AmiB activator)
MSTERELAEHGIEIKHIQTDVDTLMEDMNELKKRLDAIESALNEIKDGWKVFIFIAGLASAVVSWIVTHWFK